MPRKKREKRNINLPTCRASETEEAKLHELAEQLGYEKLAQLWRRIITQLIEQSEGGREIEPPLRFVEKTKPGTEKSSQYRGKGLK